MPPSGSHLNLIAASRQDATLTTVREWVQSGAARRGPNVRDCIRSCGVNGCRSGTCQWTRRGDCGIAGLLRQGASQLMVPSRERQDMICRFHDSLSAGYFPNGLSSTGPGLLAGVASRCSFLPGIMYGLPGPEVPL